MPFPYSVLFLQICKMRSKILRMIFAKFTPNRTPFFMLRKSFLIACFWSISQIVFAQDDKKFVATEKKIQEHLNNEDDIITIQDIANAPTGLVSKKDRREPTDLTPTEVDAFNEDEEISDTKKVKDNDDPAIETSWNILGS